MRSTFDINFFGAHMFMQARFTHLRAAGGRIIDLGAGFGPRDRAMGANVICPLVESPSATDYRELHDRAAGDPVSLCGRGECAVSLGCGRFAPLRGVPGRDV